MGPLAGARHLSLKPLWAPVAALSWATSAAAASCSVSTPALLDFGAYDTTHSLAPAAWAYQLSCTRTMAGNQPETVSLTLSFSVGAGTYAARTMNSGSQVLRYNLYLDSAHTQVLGDGSNGSVQAPTVAVTLTQQVPQYNTTQYVYAYLPGGQNVNPGSYGSLQPIVVTLTY